MELKKYALLFKTGDAELRALENLNVDKKNIFPIVELTRGRKSKNDKTGLVQKRIEKLSSIFGKHTICLDLTTARDLSNTEIELLYKFDNGYKNWIDYLNFLKEEKKFKGIIPVLLVDTEDENLDENLKLQATSLCEIFSAIAYRNNISDDGCYDDIETIKEIISESKTTLNFIIDCEYVAPGSWRNFADKIAMRVDKISKQIKNVNFIIVSTSFPKYVSEIGKDYTDTFRLNEIDIFDEVIKNIEDQVIIFGDYGSINPIRNDQVIMSRGWIPRIDVPLARLVFYYRERRDGREYSTTYSHIARNYVVNDDRFPQNLNNNWGIRQILLCANRSSPGSSPSFWISVRMNIHIEQQLKRLKLLK